MPVNVYCPHCIAACRVPDQYVGKPIRCHRCAKSFTVQPSAVTAAVPQSEPVDQSPPGPPRLDIGTATSAGRLRPRNEDSFLVKYQAWSNLDKRHEIALIVVADGMGGYDAGDQASGMAIRAIGSALDPLLGGALSGQFKDASAPILGETIAYAIEEANRGIYRKSQADSNCKGMGATTAVVLIWDDQVLIGHVGDCRVYHQRAGRLAQVTRDQTLVARMIELGTLTPEEASKHPNRNEVSQALGKRFDLAPAAYKLKLELNDWLLVACDGLHAHVDGVALQQEISGCVPSAPALARHLVNLANQKGGSDNCTVVAVRCA